MFRHTPVLAEQVIQFLNPRPGGFFIDATVGAGGHSRAILELTAPDGKLLAIDQDESALTQAGRQLVVFGPRVVFVHANFREVAQVAAAHGFSGCDGVLADIGISSMSVVGTGGRIVVITFHSLEDRIVKQKFRAPAVAGLVLTRKVVAANESELQRNPRSRSAKLRAWERS